VLIVPDMPDTVLPDGYAVAFCGAVADAPAVTVRSFAACVDVQVAEVAVPVHAANADGAKSSTASASPARNAAGRMDGFLDLRTEVPSEDRKSKASFCARRGAVYAAGSCRQAADQYAALHSGAQFSGLKKGIRVRFSLICPASVSD
jgi:hypothetical protein